MVFPDSDNKRPYCPIILSFVPHSWWGWGEEIKRNGILGVSKEQTSFLESYYQRVLLSLFSITDLHVRDNN
jgi:hypothetical protein